MSSPCCESTRAHEARCPSASRRGSTEIAGDETRDGEPSARRSTTIDHARGSGQRIRPAQRAVDERRRSAVDTVWPRPARRPASTAARAIACAAALSCLAPASTARAEQPPATHALVLPTSVRGPAAGKAGTWDARIDQRLGAAGATRLDVRPTAEEARCRDDGCLGRALKKHRADLVVRAAVDARAAGLRLRLLLLRQGEARARYEESECAACSAEAAALRLDEMLDRALAPAGGAGGAAEPLAAGAAPAAGLALRTLDDPEPEVDAPPPGSVARPVPASVRAAEGALGAGIALGLVGVGLGGRFLYDDNRPACTPVPPATQCPRLGDTRGLGLGLVFGGGALAVAAAVALVYVELRLAHPATPKVTLAPAVAPGFAGFSLALSLGGAP